MNMMRRWLYFARLQVKFADHLRLSRKISWPACRRHPEQKRPRLRPNVNSRVLDGGQDRRIDDAPDRR